MSAPPHAAGRPGTAAPPAPASAWTGARDIVDFVERTTYAIWNDYQPDLVMACYTPRTVIWGDGGDLSGDVAVAADTRARQTAFPDYRGVISDTIWTGSESAGYRTSMRWVSRGTHTGRGPLGPPTGRQVVNSCIANCVVHRGQYLEEWGSGNGRYLLEQLGLDVDAAAAALRPSQVPAGAAGRARTRELGVTVPAVPSRLDGAGALVADLLDGLYNRRDLELADRRYLPGAPYTFGVSRWDIGPAGVRREVTRWLDLLPDLRLTIEELYWNDDSPHRSRVAVRYRIAGTGRGRSGGDREVSVTGIHHLHIRGDSIVAEWAEYDELALHARLA